MNPRRISCRLRRRGITTIIGLIAVAVSSTRLNADEATKQRFLREYPAASNLLLKRFDHVRCSFESDMSTNEAGTSARFWRSGRFEKIATRRTTDAPFSGYPIEEVIALHGKTPYFRIVRRMGDEPFADLTEQGKASKLSSLLAKFQNSRNPIEAIRETIESRESWYWSIMNRYESIGSAVVYAPWGGAPGRIANWLDSGEASLVDAKMVEGEPGMIEIRFRKPEIHFLLDFVVRLDTNNHWAMKSMEVSRRDTGEVHYRTDVDYGKPIDGIAWPRRVSIEPELEYRILEWAFEPTPKAEFYRSHYGLQDPSFEWIDPWILALLTLAMAVLAFRIGRGKFRKRAIRSSMANLSSSEDPAVR